MSKEIKNKGELVKEVLSGSRKATVLRLIGQAVSWVCTIMVVRYLTPVDYGLNAMLETAMVILIVVSTLGLDSALVQAQKLEESNLQAIFGWLIVINILLFVLMFFGSPFLASFYNEPNLDSMGKAISVIFLLVPFRIIPNALMDRDLEFSLKAKVEMYVSILTALLTLCMAYFGLGVWSLVLGVILNRFLGALILMKIKPWLIRPRFNFIALGPLLSFGGMLTISGLFLLASDKVVPVIIGPTLGSEALGYFAVSLEFAALALSKGMPIINQTLLPAFSRLQEDKMLSAYYLERLVGVVALFFVPALIGLASVAESFVTAVLGKAWLESIQPLQVMSVAMVFRLCTSLYKSVISSNGRTDLHLLLSAFQFVFHVIGALFAMNYGLFGLAISWALVEFLVMLLTLAVSKKISCTSFAGLVKALLPAVFCSLCMASVVICVPLIIGEYRPFVQLLVQGFIGAMLYFFLLRMLFRDNLNLAIKVLTGKGA